MQFFVSFLGVLKMGSRSKKKFIITRKSKQILNLLSFLSSKGYIHSFSEEGYFLVRVNLKYKPNGDGIFDDLKVCSRSSQSVYLSCSYLKRFEKHKNLILVLTTSKGFMEGSEAVRLGLGGTLLCFFVI